MQQQQKASPAQLSPSKIIALKRDKKKLSPSQIEWFIQGLSNGEVADYQASALLMAIYLNGMDDEETAALTDAMLYSGKVIDFKGDVAVVDKHSTGGVGDKASFILAAIAAACGVKVPMMAGRGLGHTGGTVDKIEAIPGLNTQLDLDTFQKLVCQNGIALIGQTKDIAVADKKLYALRDVTATVESIPLITASIMSKKLAEGAMGIVMDIKTGDGAFMAEIEDAKQLAKSLTETGLRFGRSMMTIITDMNQPLGYAIGNANEIIESLEVLKGQGPEDLRSLSLELAAGMIFLARKAPDMDQARTAALQALDSGKALQIFKEMIEKQGGDISFIESPGKLLQGIQVAELNSSQSGYIQKIACKKLGQACVTLGGGRLRQEDSVDHQVGINFYKKIGDQVQEGEKIADIFYQTGQEELVEQISQEITTKYMTFSNHKVAPVPLIYDFNYSLAIKDKKGDFHVK